jgi:hypothetical protein
MLQHYLSQHPDLTPWYEPRTVWIYAAPGRTHDRFEEADATPRVVRYIQRRFLRYQEKYGGLRVLEKTPSNTMRIPYVRRIFPSSQIVYIVRNPLDQLSSSEVQWRSSIRFSKLISRIKETPTLQLPYYARRLFVDLFRKKLLKSDYVSTWGVRYPGIQNDMQSHSVEEIIAKQWVACSQQARSDLEALPNNAYISVKYEDVVRDPVPAMENICDHLKLSLSDEMKSMIEEKTRKSRQGMWNRLPQGTLIKCVDILRDEMELLGYDVPTASEIERIGISERQAAEAKSLNTSYGRITDDPERQTE